MAVKTSAGLGIAKNLRAVGLALIIFLAASAGAPSAQDSPAPAANAATPKAIQPSEVATRSSEVINLLMTVSEKLAFNPEIEKIQQSLPDISRQIDLDFTGTYITLAGQPSLAALEAQRAQWQRRHLRLSTGLALSTDWVNDLQEAQDRLSQMRAIWTQTRDAAEAGKAPEEILQQISRTLASIEVAERPLTARMAAALGVQADIARQKARCDAVLAQIVKARNVAIGGILARESLPIWSPDLWRDARTDQSGLLRDIGRGFWLGVRNYAQDPSYGMPLHVALFLVLTGMSLAARRKRRLWKAAGEDVSPALDVFERPYSAALIIVLLAATAVISPAPAPVKNLLSVLELVPMFRLVRPMIEARFAPPVFTAAIFYAVDFGRQILGGVPLVDQALLVLESLAAIVVLAWMLHAEHRRGTSGRAPNDLRTGRLQLSAKALIIALSACCFTAVFGFTRLARLGTPAIVFGGASALSLYAYVLVASGALPIALRVWPLRILRMVRHHGGRIERWIHRLLVWTAILFWTVRSLEYIGILDPLRTMGDAVLGLKLERGSVNISIGDILALGLTVLAAFLLSALIRFVLREEIYPRRGVARGMAYAYSRLIHYSILTIGFLVGLGVLGMDLTRVTVMAGAFGVGIGFGLQNVVNNFVCGLILLFERPVHVGDSVEVGGFLGEVRRIGIRASTVRIRQGADIILPNAEFITANVTNWTLGDQLRRIDMPLGVNYGTAPRKVIEVLESVAAAHPRVLKNPPPQAVFKGFGESSLDFELWAWTDNFADWYTIRSELGAVVYDGVRAAGMSFPFPQREVRLLRDNDEG